MISTNGVSAEQCIIDKLLYILAYLLAKNTTSVILTLAFISLVVHLTQMCIGISLKIISNKKWNVAVMLYLICWWSVTTPAPCHGRIVAQRNEKQILLHYGNFCFGLSYTKDLKYQEHHQHPWEEEETGMWT